MRVYLQIIATGIEPTEGQTMKFGVFIDSDMSKAGGKRFETTKEYFSNESEARRRFYEVKRSAPSNTLCITLVDEGDVHVDCLDSWTP